MARHSNTGLGSAELFNILLNILAVTVLIDHREKDRELIEFTHAAILHSQQLQPEIISCRKIMTDWFHTHKADIKQHLMADADGSYKEGLLACIKDGELQRRLLSSIFTIAVCDYELHDEESDFIKTALKVWKAEMPTPIEVESVA